MKNFLLRLLEYFTTEHIQKTGEKAEFSGVYRSEAEYVPIAKGERLPPLGNGVWHLVVRL